MEKESVLRINFQFRDELSKNEIKVDRLILYGSYANGVPRLDSDIDLVVISKDFEAMGYWDRIKVLSKSVLKVFSLLEPVALTPEEWEAGNSLIREFAKNGKVIV